MSLDGNDERQGSALDLGVREVHIVSDAYGLKCIPSGTWTCVAGKANQPSLDVNCRGFGSPSWSVVCPVIGLGRAVVVAQSIERLLQWNYTQNPCSHSSRPLSWWRYPPRIHRLPNEFFTHGPPSLPYVSHDQVLAA